MNTERAQSPGVVALLTDFGLADPYVGQMKAALLRRVPTACLVDISHEVPSFGVAQASFFLESSRPHFPERTVFLSVVDPCVGGPRRIVCLDAYSQLFLAPDNGILTLVLDAALAAGVPVRAFDLTPANLDAASRTFHGRDVFAPLAAQLAAGVVPELLGRQILLEDLTRLDLWRPEFDASGAGLVRLRVLHVDRFGNCICNATGPEWFAKLATWPAVWMHAPEVLQLSLVSSYYQLAPRAAGLLIGSQCFLELALNMASAADYFHLSPGGEFVIAAAAPGAASV